MKSLDVFLKRRSVPAKWLSEPGPDKQTLEHLLTAALRVPDHGKLEPWRLIVIQGDARRVLGFRLADIRQKQQPEITQLHYEEETYRFCRAPVVVAVVSQAADHKKIPVWEQQLSSAAVCMTLIHAAHQCGFGAQWLTEWVAYNDDAKNVLGIAEEEAIAGFIYIGTPEETMTDRKRPDMSEKVIFWEG
jgi:nitroreductase